MTPFTPEINDADELIDETHLNITTPLKKTHETGFSPIGLQLYFF